MQRSALALIVVLSIAWTAASQAIKTHTGRNGPLTPSELTMARTAWKYFEQNTQAKTGLANSVEYYPSATFWDTASYMGGLVSAYELKLIQKDEFDRRMSLLLKTLDGLSFYRDELPNKAYNTETAEKVDYNNKPGEIGYSALDLGRLLIWLKIVKERYPEHADAIDQFVLRWKFCNIVDGCGRMYGAVDTDHMPNYLQEGRLGYEEYSAAGFQLWGVNVAEAARPEPYETVSIYNVEVPYDSRDPRKYHAHNYVVSESYLLDGIELNWDLATDRTSDDSKHTNAWMSDFADRIYRVQEARYKATQKLTARTEHQLAAAPYFVYDTIFTDGYPWNTITEAGEFVPDMAAVATKAAIGLWALWDTPYTAQLFQYVSPLGDPEHGFYEGKFENSGNVIKAFTANTNGIILETLLYKSQGKLLRFGNRDSAWDRAIKENGGAPLCRPNIQRKCGDPRMP